MDVGYNPINKSEKKPAVKTDIGLLTETLFCDCKWSLNEGHVIII